MNEQFLFSKEFGKMGKNKFNFLFIKVKAIRSKNLFVVIQKQCQPALSFLLSCDRETLVPSVIIVFVEGGMSNSSFPSPRGEMLCGRSSPSFSSPFSLQQDAEESV